MRPFGSVETGSEGCCQAEGKAVGACIPPDAGAYALSSP